MKKGQKKDQFKKPILDPLEFKDIYNIWKNAMSKAGKKAQFEFALLYLTGARVGEIVQVRKADFKKYKKGEKEYLTVTLPTLKNRRRRSRIIPLVKEEPYTEMVESIEDYLYYLYPTERIIQVQTARGLRKKISKVGEFETMAIYPNQRKKKEVKRSFYPHFLRHCRLTHLVKYHHFDGNRLMYFAGWSDPRLSSIYVSLDWYALAEMIKANQVPQEW